MKHFFQAMLSERTGPSRERGQHHCHSGDGHGHGRGHGRSRGGHGGHGGHGGRSMDGSDGGGNLMRGRKFSSDDLQLLLLALLAERPSHGYELIKALQTRTEGFYSPSPGMVYPALTYIEELGYANVSTESNKKSYSLSPEGEAYLASKKERVDELFAGIAHMARKMKFLRGAMSEEAAADESGWLPEFIEARRTLKRALMMKSGADHDEQRRIAAILMRTATDIEQP